MPDPKREAGRLGLRLPLARTVSRAKTLALPPPEPKKEAKANPAPSDAAAGLMPPPPDVPQARAQLFDFIEALKKRRAPMFVPKKATGPSAPQPSALRKKRTTPRKRTAAKSSKKPVALVAERTSADNAQFGLGYGPQPTSRRRNIMPPSPPAKLPAPIEKPAPPPSPPRAERRPPPRPAARVPGTSPPAACDPTFISLRSAWVSLRSPSRIRTSCPSTKAARRHIVSSQATDLTQVQVLTGHTGCGAGGHERSTRAGGSSRRVRTGLCACGTPATAL